eukprot:CAMPEP_0170593334 /NCGR_PEP_ID=MMETSP0224-20130122/13392_1 /TAXON_ID=285029 /ORGANISM="Togula jolla, Strain CCCM 725" /LENGTH=728 /DNA_ID=CAMNT_0010917279 /DNA_START=62 /DNA_END=2248 /DNA_ORIENTATION=+
MRFVALAALAALNCASLTYASLALASSASPVEKVVSLLQQMKAQVDKDAAQDADAFSKHSCWCETNQKTKDAAVEAAETQIGELESFIEEAAGLEAQLKTEIGELVESIASDKQSLATATALREKEKSEYEGEAKDMTESIATLEQAIAVLQKVQLLQRKGHPVAKPLLMQLKTAIHAVHDRLGQFRGVMQRDLWDVLSSLGEAEPSAAFLTKGGRKTALAQGDLAQPTGDAAGAKSYNSRSGSIVGVLSGLKDDFAKNLAAAESEEADAMASFSSMKATKEEEIATAKSQKAAKEQALTDTLMKASNAKADIEATKDALSADQRFLVELSKTCKVSQEEYAERSKTRSEESRALAETIKILTEDNARDLFGKTFSFLQTGKGVKSRGHQAGTSAAQSKALNLAMQRILHVARKQKNWILATLAVRVRLDSFAKVKELMAKMLEELKEQQKSETEKLETCKKDIDEKEDSIKVKTQSKEDLEGLKQSLEGSIASTQAEIDQLKEAVTDMQVSLKQAGEQRKEENALFQQDVQDQRATIEILNKALKHLQAFYSKGSLMQLRSSELAVRQEPGRAASPPPPPAKEYEKSGGAGGVLQLMSKIISDATKAEAELVASEQHAQEDYATLANDAAATLAADEASITEKTQRLENANAEKSEVKASLMANTEELASLTDLLKGVHLECDFLLKFYDVRQKARSEEMAAIVEAKGILSGATFGQAMEEADAVEG